MALPKAVQQQVEAADQMQQELYSPEAVALTDQTPEGSPAAEAASAQVIEMHRQVEPVKVEETRPTHDDSVDWKQRYATLQGKFDAEVPRLYQQLREQGQQMSDLIQRLQAKEQEPTTDKSPSAPDYSKFEEDYGGDLVGMVKSVATDTIRQAVASEMAQFRREFGAVQAAVGQVAERVVKSESDKFWDSVMSIVPDWAQVDQDPRWIEFLDSTPDYSEDSYREIASKAIQKGNAQKVAKLVETWKSQAGLSAPAPTKATPNLSRQVAPSTTRASSSPVQQERIWSKDDYEAAYDVRNVQRFGMEKASQLIADADRAVAEGRVRW